MASKDMKASFPSTQVLQVVDTELCADSVEWNQSEEFKTLLICGMYQLAESTPDDSGSKKSERLGRLNLYQLNNQMELSLTSSVDGAGILDTKWHPDASGCSFPMLGVANALGQIEFFRIKKMEDEKLAMQRIDVLQAEDNGLALSLDWQSSNTTHLAVSSSLGNISVHQIQDGRTHPELKWGAHDYEAWTCAFDKWNSHIVYTGGDDSKLKVWDLRNEPIKPISTLTRHSMGVTCIQSNPHQENILCTGSYDESILFWDARNFKQPLASHQVGGGVWRVKWNPHEEQCIAAACMYNGSHIIRLNSDHTTVTEASFFDHQSLTYGIDWFYGTPNKSESRDENCSTLATCSFYDHNLQLWHWNSKKLV